MKTMFLHGRVMLLMFLLTQVIVFSSYAQESFRLSDYVNPDYRWRKLDLGFGMGGNNEFSSNKFITDLSHEGRENVVRFSGNASLSYYATKNTRSYQGYQQAWVSGNMLSLNNVQKDITNDLENSMKQNGQTGWFGIITENRFYNSRKQFLETDLHLAIGVSNHAYKYNRDEMDLPFLSKSQGAGFVGNITLPIMVGIGRIEEVQDARLAVYILDDLLKSSDLKRAATNDEILEFARFITQTKNKRYFDERIQKIQEITDIDSALATMGLKSRSGASYYTLLNDNWDYANGPVRKTGGRFSVGIAPAFEYDIQNNTAQYQDTIVSPSIIEEYEDKTEQKIHSWGLDCVAAYAWEKPANLYWQHSINTGAAYALYQERLRLKAYSYDTLSIDYLRDRNSPNLNIFFDYTIGYYPNSRTEVVLSLNNSMQNYWNTLKYDEIENNYNQLTISHELVVSCYYYISPQLRLTIDISNAFSYEHNKDIVENGGDDKDIHNNLLTNISAGFVYKIF